MSAAKPHFRAGHKAMKAGRPQQAITHFAKAVGLAPGNLDFVEALGEAFQADGQALNALRAFDRIITAGKARSKTWLAAGEAFMELKENAQALDAFEHCLELEPDHANAHHGLALAAYHLGEVNRAATHLSNAFREESHLSSLASRATLLPGAPKASHHDILAARRLLADHLEQGSPLANRSRPGPYQNQTPRIAYLSSHFSAENYMKPVWALLNHLDRERFDLHLLADCTLPAASFPGFVRHPNDHIHEVRTLSNQELARFIELERIDLLVDLNSYSTLDRLELFLSPVAPVVATWFNAFATSGLPGIDVLIGDDESIRPAEEEFYSERVMRLPLSYLTFNVTHDVPPVVDPPCRENGVITFGSLVTQYKITPEVIEAWSAILRGAPSSRLILANRTLDSTQDQEWLRARFADQQVDPSRLTVLPSAPHGEFLRYYDQIDLALDPFPYNGGTTTMESIWQGVPVCTFDGDRWASRTSQTILRRTHLAEFVAPSCEAMIARAIALANDPATPGSLIDLRRSMRRKLSASSACDGAALARATEQLYLELLPG